MIGDKGHMAGNEKMKSEEIMLDESRGRRDFNSSSTVSKNEFNENK